MSKELTPNQREALQAVADGKVRRTNCGYGAWRTQGASPTVVGRLVSLGLVKLDIFGENTATLTDAGTSALKAQGAQQ